MVPEKIMGSMWVAWGTSQEQVRFVVPFYGEICEDPAVLLGLGAARNLNPDPADPADPADPLKVVHGRQFAP